MKIFYTTIYKLIAVIIFLFTLNTGKLSAQGPGDPPPPPDSHGYGSHQNPGGGAPVGGGLIVLLASSAMYAAHKGLIKDKGSVKK